MQGRPPVFLCTQSCIVQRIRKNGHSGTLLPKSGCEMLHLCRASGNVISQQQNRSRKVVAVRTVTRYFLPENVRVNGYDGNITTFSIP